MEQEELKDFKTAVEKDQLLQKYGIIEPKLTEYDKWLITFDQLGAE